MEFKLYKKLLTAPSKDLIWDTLGTRIGGSAKASSADRQDHDRVRKGVLVFDILQYYALLRWRATVQLYKFLAPQTTEQRKSAIDEFIDGINISTLFS